MKIDDMISELQAISKRHGNLEVLAYPPQYRDGQNKPVVGAESAAPYTRKVRNGNALVVVIEP